MVNRPQDFRWTSYHANALGKTSSLITPQDEYLRLALNETERLEAYRALFYAQLDEKIVGQICKATNGNFALGNDRFQQEIEIALGRRASRARTNNKHEAGSELSLPYNCIKRGLSPISMVSGKSFAFPQRSI
ncbi:MAG TPA: hypothetical protein PLU16_05380 [Gallionellaceae bacterium]|jgi:putative transposase|nr:hypothetical protein [Gallionellaceae bacterium]HQS74621.1 hypothetical protein [Gallionellaceae bacterium]